MAWDRAGAWNSGVQGLSSSGSTITIASGYQLLLPDGSAALPPYSFTNYPLDGLWHDSYLRIHSESTLQINSGAGSGLLLAFAGNNIVYIKGDGLFDNVANTHDIGATDGGNRFKSFYAGTSYVLMGASGQKKTEAFLTELTTINAAATTDTAIQIPLNAVVYAVQVRVTVAIPTAATFTVTGATSGTQFDVAGGVSVNINTTDVGTANCPYKNGAAQSIRITPNIQPATNVGRVRVTIHYYTITPATS